MQDPDIDQIRIIGFSLMRLDGSTSLALGLSAAVRAIRESPINIPSGLKMAILRPTFQGLSPRVITRCLYNSG
jgi:hypothetical protein